MRRGHKKKVEQKGGFEHEQRVERDCDKSFNGKKYRDCDADSGFC